MTMILAGTQWEARALAALEAKLAQAGAMGLPTEPLRRALVDPLQTFLGRPGKALRAALVGHGWHLAGGNGEPPVAVLALVELLHAGSLILDDIQDDAALRRGQAALHRQYGVPLALNAGTYLLFIALDLCDDPALPPGAAAALRRLTLDTLIRCHEGQALDLSVKVTGLAQGEIPAVVVATTDGKTGALMGLAAGAGALAAGATDATVSAIVTGGRQIGTALQMLDDLGSLTRPDRLHKGIEDLWGDRPTWPWAWLAESLSIRSFAALQRQLAAVVQRDLAPEPLLAAMAAALGDRRAAIRACLEAAFDDLGRTLGPSPALDTLRYATLRMEQDYV